MLPTAEQIIEAEQDDELLPQELVNLEADSRLAWIIQNNMVTENGDPLDFYDHPFLVDIYDDDSDDIQRIQPPSLPLGQLVYFLYHLNGVGD